jgi:replicative DNA helicase
MGKTSLALNIAVNAAFKANADVMVFSLEMSRSSLGMRLLSTQAEVDLMQIRNGQALKDTAKASKLGEAQQDLSETKIIIDDTAAIHINEIKNKCRRVRSKEGKLDLIIIDYLQLMDMGTSINTTSRPENRQQEIATLTRMLKQLARDMECPVLVLSQLSRDIEKRSNKLPVLSDLRESGAIEQDADLVMFIYQGADNDDGNGPDINLTRQLSVAKHRNGETGSITLRWLKEYTKFAHYDPQADWVANV